MNTKETIEFLESEKPSNFTGRELQNVRSEDIKEEKLKQVIALLKAYEAIVEEFKNIFYILEQKFIPILPLCLLS